MVRKLKDNPVKAVLIICLTAIAVTAMITGKEIPFMAIINLLMGM